jgi:hypothetical protein
MKLTPSEQQMNALVMFAATYGARWKSALRRAWETGNYDGFEPANDLQMVRNIFGPSWLVRFNLKKALGDGHQELYSFTRRQRIGI